MEQKNKEAMMKWKQTMNQFHKQQHLPLQRRLLLLITFIISSTTLISQASSQSIDSNNKIIGLNKPFSSSVFSNLNHFPCVSLYHRNGRIGCGTLDRAETSPSSIVYWKNIGPSEQEQGDKEDDDKNYVAVMTDLEYTTANVGTLLTYNENDIAHILGILVVNHTVVSSDNNNEYTTAFTSSASMYPQGFNTPSASLSQYTNNQYAWNPTGDSISYQDYYGIPTVLLSDVDISTYIYHQSKEQLLGGNEASKIVAEFNYYMGPDDTTSADCLLWKDTDGSWNPKCLPIGGNSIWSATGTPPPSVSSNQENDDGGNENANDDNNDNNDNQWNSRDVILLSTSIDATAAFHDASTGASTAASNIMTLLLAAHFVGQNLSWEDLDSLSRQIVFAFFEGEAYGYMGSRNFIKDKEYPGLECNYPNGAGCMYPIRPTLNFQNLGEIVGMIAVDQVGTLATEKSFYVHADDNGEDLENILLQFSADGDDDAGSSYEYNVAGSSVDDAIPPSPLISMIELSEGAVGGVVLSGYDDAFLNGVYESHFDSSYNIEIDLDAIQNAALLLARSGIAAAYNNDDNEDGVAYAKTMIPEINEDDEEYSELVNNLYTCLFEDGMCKFWQKYTDTEQKNEKERTGIDLGKQGYRFSMSDGAYGKNTPNYYVGVYDLNHGQPVVQVEGKFYAAYNKTVDEIKKKDKDGTYLMKPSALEAGIYGLMNDFLGQKITSSNDDGTSNTLTTCSSTNDCKKVSYCPDLSICTGGGNCVCGPSSFYHIAIDESIEAVPNTTSGKFRVIADDKGNTPMYTEPYWSASVGVTLFEQAGADMGEWVLLGGAIVVLACAGSSIVLKKKMVKAKLY